MLSHYTFNSIRSQEYQKKMKKSHHLKYSPDAQDLYYKRYKDGVSKGRQHILLDMADEVDLSLALLARIILEKHLAVSHRDGENISRSYLTQLMKEPNLIEDPILATEISQCIYSDDFYGPLTDSIKHAIGYEYEVKLKRQLGKLGHSFIGEDQMRLKGYDKTPDVKLEIPIAVDGYIVNWIESKASFGDDFTHKTYLKDQFWSYWNRFGPGMVIYWFGFIEDLDVNQDKGIILRHEFPENIVTMNPLG
ncbi:CDAN1-interacting nuclease 1 isoform X2 [Patella vulgata]|uniref:CDAN1-interacting nuclease 1 isoform X2 n=1 Tax=Patella vulgata TaxID=6465 RepID=UPI00218084B8|nr:CDAN1-interacting nuclease 1 isoform X2 [Patella vulgata]